MDTFRQEAGDGPHSPEPVDTSLRTAKSLGRDLAVERVKAYFRCAGVEGEELLENISRRIVDEARSSSGSRPTRAEAVNSQSICSAVAVLDRWLDDQLSRHGVPPSAAARSMLVWQLRAIRSGGGEAHLLRGALPDTLRHAVLACALPTTPPAQPRPMPQQPFGELPVMLRASFWRRLTQRLRIIILQSSRILWGQ